MNDRLREEFKCFYCQEIPETPFESECCGKLYCETCSEAASFLNCKVCKDILKFKTSLFASNLMNKFNTFCTNNCGKEIKFSDSKLHNLVCNNRLFSCKINKCSFRGNKDAIKQHILLVHSSELIILCENYAEFKPFLKKYCSKLSISKEWISNLNNSNTSNEISNDKNHNKSNKANKEGSQYMKFLNFNIAQKSLNNIQDDELYEDFEDVSKKEEALEEVHNESLTHDFKKRIQSINTDIVTTISNIKKLKDNKVPTDTVNWNISIACDKKLDYILTTPSKSCKSKQDEYTNYLLSPNCEKSLEFENMNSNNDENEVNIEEEDIVEILEEEKNAEEGNDNQQVPYKI